MGHLVTIKAGLHGVSLPNNQTYDAGDSVVLTDEEWAEVSASAIGRLLTDGGPTQVGPVGPPGAAAQDGEWLASDHGFKGWTFDTALAVNVSAPAAGTAHAIGFRVRNAMTINHIYLGCSAVGVGTTNAFAALYDATEHLLSQSNNQASAMGATGLKAFPLAAAQAVNPGLYYLVFWTTASTTVPSFARSATQAGLPNALLTAATGFRYATADAGLTTTAPPVLGAMTALNVGWWAAVD